MPAQPVLLASAKDAAQASAVRAAALPPTSSVTLVVKSARDSLAYSSADIPSAAQKLDPIPDLRRNPNGQFVKPNAPKDYHWLINLDNTGNSQGGKDSPACHPSTNPNYPQGCTWPSIRYSVASPAISAGTFSDWNDTTTLPLYDIDANGNAVGLPDSCDINGNPVPHALGVAPAAGTVACRYLVSVTANGYQMGGAHFSVPMADPGIVRVFMNPTPIPLGTMRLRVFNDNHPTDGQFDHMTEVGLPGFLGVVFDVDGILQADFYGNSLCTTYKTNSQGQILVDSYGKPTPNEAKDPAPKDVNGYYNPTVPGRCLSDTNGDIVIPNLAPNHYSARVTPPDFDPTASNPYGIQGAPVANPAWSHWLQTTTLEGNHDHDVWVMPNDTGLDTELVVGGEAVPFVDFGFIATTTPPSPWVPGANVDLKSCPAGPPPSVVGETSGCGQIKGQIFAASAYSPSTGAIAQVPLAGGGGIKLDGPLDRGWVALNNINVSTGDTEANIATIPTDAQGRFSFINVPDGDYLVAFFDEPQDYILDMVSVTVSHGQALDMGVVPLFGWFTHVFGHVFIDLNGNGRQDPGEPGVFHAFVQNLNRTNNTMVGGIATTLTDNTGFYNFTEAYPLGLMSINQFFNTRYKTIGVTWQACNDPKEHTIVAPMVDISYLPLISQCGRLDWGVQPYNPSANGDNGGIVATLIYDQTRQKYNARQAQTGDFQTGIPGFRFEQYTPIKAPAGTPLVDPGTGLQLVDPMTGYLLRTDAGHEGQYQTVENLTAPDGGNCASPSVGAYTPGVTPLCYVSESNNAPTKCYPKDANGVPLGYDPTNPKSFDFVMYGGACIEAPASSVQFGVGTDNAGPPLNHPVQTVDGNYTLGNGSTIPAKNLGDTLVRAVVPVDHVLQGDATRGICPAAGPFPLGCDLAQQGLPRKLFTYTKEEDVNLFTGAQFVPQGAHLAGLPWPPRANYFAGTSPTGVTQTSLTDSAQSWVQNAFAGDQVKMGGRTATVASNTATTLTFTAAGWSGGAVPPGLGPYTVRAQEIVPGNYDENQYTTSPGIDPICAGSTHIVRVTNPDLLANGGSPFEGQSRHFCDMKLLNVQAGQSIAPNFHVRTAVDIPLPTHFVGLVLDDVSVEASRKHKTLGEVAGIPGVPVGLYDWTGRRVGKVISDYNGQYEILMPSESLNNCPVPAGTCPNVYRFVANDPGQPGRPNLEYNPNYRTISANFEAWPNMLVPADNAPTRVVTNINSPGLAFSATSPCGIKDLEPQLFAVGPNPFTYADDVPETITIDGANFGTAGHVEYAPLNGDAVVRLRLAGPWTNNQVKVYVGANEVGSTGAGRLTVFNDSAVDATTGKTPRSTSGLTFHVLGGGYNPHIIKVGPGREQRNAAGQLIGIDPFAVNAAGKILHPFPIQEALDLAAARWQDYGRTHVDATHTVNEVANSREERYMVVVYPNWSPTRAENPSFVPLGTYFENLIIHSPLKLQGVGPGGAYADPVTGKPVAIQGSIIDGRFFTTVTPNVDIAAVAPDPATDSQEPVVLHWVNLLAAIQNSTHGTGFLPASVFTPQSPPWTGQQSPLGEAAVITVIGTKGTYPTGFKAAVDGFTISGGEQKDFPGNINQMGGGVVHETGAGLPGQPVGAVNTQGGAIYLNGGTDHFQITNNIVRQNSGSYGAIRMGTPFHGSPQSDGGSSHNWRTAISHNQIAFNGGTNLAGAVGLFSDSNYYSVDHNTFCMNMALEYGGAVSHFGFSPNGSITYNKMLLNTSVDEAGAIMVASEPAFKVVGGEQVPDPAGTTEGSGEVSIDHNYIGLNIAQDDGGAIRLMGTTGKGDPTKRYGLSPITISNNMLTNNISSHEGGAISMNDAPVVNIVNNTFAGNVTTATATTSNGAPAPAGISSGTNSAGLMALLNGQYAGQSPEWMLTGTTAPVDAPRVWPDFSSPLIENDIFFDNRAGSWATSGIAQLGMPGDTSAINRWDVGSVDGKMLRVRYSLIYSAPGAASQTWGDDGNNKIYGFQTPQTNPLPGFVSSYNVCRNDPPVMPQDKGCLMVQVQQLRTYFRFRPAAIVSVDLPDNALGDYHLTTTGSPAHAMGANPQDWTIDALTDDIDGNARPTEPTLVTAGAHEVTAPPPALPAPAPPAPGPPPVVAPAVGAQGSPSGAGNVVPNIAPNVVPNVVPIVASNVAPNAAPNVAANVTADAAATVTGQPNATQGTIDTVLAAFARIPNYQRDMGLGTLIGLIILGAVLLVTVNLRRRQNRAEVFSEEQNIEGGEQQ